VRTRLQQQPLPLWGVPALLLLLGVGALVGAPAPLAQTAHAAPDAHVVSVRASPPQEPEVGRWVDPSDATAYVLRLRTAGPHPAGEFTFLLPNGDQLHGIAPLVAQPDGTSAQQASSSLGACAGGSLATPALNASQASPAGIPPEKGRGGPKTYAVPVVYALQSRVGPSGLVAYAGLSYALASDSGGVATVCGGEPPTYQMASGCTSSTCTDVLATAGPTAGKHDDAVVQAAHANTVAGWEAVYQLTSRTLTGQYDDVAFANAMIAQVNSRGRITAISPIAGGPTVQFDSAGQAYFEVSQTVTLDHNGTTTTQTVTSYYVLEGGAWMFWFSA
jgi:hypothetical protein